MRQLCKLLFWAEIFPDQAVSLHVLCTSYILKELQKIKNYCFFNACFYCDAKREAGLSVWPGWDVTVPKGCWCWRLSFMGGPTCIVL